MNGFVDAVAAQSIHVQTPHTFAAMQHLFMTMDTYAKSIGKKTWFGHDKELDAFVEFKTQLRRTVAALQIDGLTSPASPDEAILDILQQHIERFAAAFPTWQRAYIYSQVLFADKKLAAELIQRVR